MATRDDTPRCGGCGKPFTEGDKVVQIVDGAMVGATRGGIKIAPGKERMKLHKTCFSHAVDSPAETLKEIRMLARGA